MLSAKGLEEMHTKHGNCKVREKIISAIIASTIRECVWVKAAVSTVLQFTG